jgi:hypothetical protein
VAIEHQIEHMRFASDGMLMLIAGGVFVAIGLFAIWGDRRRLKRKRIDSVGWIPWLPIFFVAMFIGVPMLGLGVSALANH